MELLANVILATGSLSAAAYCYILSKRLRYFNSLETGMGRSISRLSDQVDQLNQTLRDAKATAQQTNKSVSDQTKRAEDVAQRLEILLSSMHDLDLTSEEVRPCR